MTIRPLRALAAAGAIALVAGGALLLPQSASAHTSAATASAECVTDTGAAVVTYTLTNDYHQPATVTSSDVAAIPVGTELRQATGHGATSATFTEDVAAPAAGHTSTAHLTVKWRDGFTQRGITATATVDAGCTVPVPPTEEPTPPVTPEPEPTPVVVPQIQDYVTCKGGAFLLDNTGSTADVTYTINGLPYLVPAGQAVHTDADGTLLQPNSDYEGFTIKAGDRVWTFPSAGNCGTDPVTGCPTTGDPTEPCDGSTPPVVTPPTEEPTPPVETPEPTEPAQPTEPSTPVETPQPTAPSIPAPTQPASHSPSPTSSSTPSAPVTPAVDEPTDAPTAHIAGTDGRSGGSTGELAYTGSPLEIGTAAAVAGILLAVGIGALVFRTRRRRASR